jgi:hypothetical protein
MGTKSHNKAKEKNMDTYARIQGEKPSAGFIAGKESGIFLKWKTGDNILRLAGGYVETRTHFVAPNVRQKTRGICKIDAFEKGDTSISQVVNCLDWDLTTETEKRVKTCPICKLFQLASKILSETPDEKEKKFYTELKSAAAYKTGYKWNALDRDNPMVTVSDNGVERAVLGFKIATLGKEAFADVRGIFMQCGFDISSPDEGVDIKITQGNKNGRVAYQAQVVLQGKGVKQTPFIPEEAALKLRDIKQICGKQYEVARIVAAMHDDLREMLVVYDGADAPPAAIESKPQAATTAAATIIATADAAVDAALAEAAKATPQKVKVPAPVKATAEPKAKDEDDLPF